MEENTSNLKKSPLKSNMDDMTEKKVSPQKTIKFKKAETDSEPEITKKTQYDSTSLITTSSDESENSRMLRRKFEIEYPPFVRSKSTSLLFKHKYKQDEFPVVKENPDEDNENLNDEKEKERFKKLNEAILEEGYDNVEEMLSEHRPKKFTKSTKTLYTMDPVAEEKEDIDFNSLKIGPFKKLKCVMDFEEDSKIGMSTMSLHHYYAMGGFDMNETIAEDNNENNEDKADKKKHRKSYTENLKREIDFVDLSDKIEEQVAPKNIITEEIKEDPEDEEINPIEEIITNDKCKYKTKLNNFSKNTGT